MDVCGSCGHCARESTPSTAPPSPRPFRNPPGPLTTTPPPDSCSQPTSSPAGHLPQQLARQQQPGMQQQRQQHRQQQQQQRRPVQPGRRQRPDSPPSLGVHGYQRERPTSLVGSAPSAAERMEALKRRIARRSTDTASATTRQTVDTDCEQPSPKRTRFVDEASSSSAAGERSRDPPAGGQHITSTVHEPTTDAATRLVAHAAEQDGPSHPAEAPEPTYKRARRDGATQQGSSHQCDDQLRGRPRVPLVPHRAHDDDGGGRRLESRAELLRHLALHAVGTVHLSGRGEKRAHRAPSGPTEQRAAKKVCTRPAYVEP